MGLGVALALTVAGCGRTPLDVFERGALDEDLDQLPDMVSGGCPKVDYLFVIDDSASMLMHQQRLVESFDVFIDGVEHSQATLESVHVGVVTTDIYLGNLGPEHDESCHALGGLITATAGYNSSEAMCGPYAEGHRYMTELDDLETVFPCATQVGTAGSTEEYPLEALTSAVVDLSGPGECNEGFIRDDALLVVVIVTDEDDPGPVEFRYDRLVEAKGGHEDNVVMVGLVNEPGTDCPLTGHTREAPLLTEFIGMFSHSFIAPVCGDYSVAFQQAVSVVEAACQDVR